MFKKFQKKKIALVIIAGTTLLIRNNKQVISVASENDVQSWMQELPELSIVAELEPIFVQQKNSHDDLNTFTKNILEIIESKKYDGCVVVQDANKLIQLGIALELLSSYTKPIIVTGSRHTLQSIEQFSLKELIKSGNLGLRSNLINAVQLATMSNFFGTAILFGGRIIKPSRASIDSRGSMNLFKSVTGDYLGRIDFGISLKKTYARKKVKKLPSSFSNESVVFDIGMRRFDLLKSASMDSMTALIHVNHNEHFTDETVRLLKKIFNHVVLFNEEGVLPTQGVICTSGMTWDTAQVKLSWVLNSTKNDSEIEKLMNKNIVGEML